jgi:hypothetical protein
MSYRRLSETLSSDAPQTLASTAASFEGTLSNGPGTWIGLAKVFATGADQPIRRTHEEIERAFRRKRIAIILSITLGYGIAYTCRLGLSVVKKPLIDVGIFTIQRHQQGRNARLCRSGRPKLILRSV